MKKIHLSLSKPLQESIFAVRCQKTSKEHFNNQKMVTK
jgi:hypothetical protein